MILLDAIRGGLQRASVEEGRRCWGHELPRPWLGWLIVALMRQVQRQRWLVELVEARLSSPPVERGEVPELPGWSFRFHGRGCCLSGPGEEIDVDFHGDGGLTIDPYFFAARLFGLVDLGLPERRVRELLPTPDVIAEAIRELRSEGLLWHPESDHVFRIAEELEALCEEAQKADFESPEAQARWRAHLGDDDERTVVARRQWLLARLADPRTARLVLEPLEAELSAQEFFLVCEQIIEGPVSPAVGKAIERLDARVDLPQSSAVRRLATRLNPKKDHPCSMHAAATYLLRRDVDREVVVPRFLAFARLDAVKGYRGNPFAGDFALLSLEFAPEHGVELVRRALRSSVPSSRCAVAAVLVGLDRSWCHRELSLALDAFAKPADAAEVLAALRQSSDQGLRDLAERRVGQRPFAPQEGVGHSRDQLALSYADEWIKSELDRRREWLDRVGPTLSEVLEPCE